MCLVRPSRILRCVHQTMGLWEAWKQWSKCGNPVSHFIHEGPGQPWSPHWAAYTQVCINTLKTVHQVSSTTELFPPSQLLLGKVNLGVIYWNRRVTKFFNLFNLSVNNVRWKYSVRTETYLVWITKTLKIDNL